MNEKDMIRRLMLPRMTSQHMSWHELFTELNQDRNEAAEALRKVVAERDALRAELEALRGQDPALYVQSNHFANAKFAPFLARICQQQMDQIHAVPLYLAAGAQGVCETCGGRGVVGGFVSADSGYQDDPCPDCSRPAQSAPDGWKPIETAPKSTADGSHIHGIYVLGFCPDPDLCNLESAVCVVWWEPLMNGGKGMWYGEGGYEVRPTHWSPLPAAPKPEKDQ